MTIPNRRQYDKNAARTRARRGRAIGDVCVARPIPMKPLNEEHLAIYRRHMVEVVDVHFDLLGEEIGKPQMGERLRSVLSNVPRHLFVPPELAAVAYHDGPLPIGFDKTISQPFIVALMVDLLDIQAEDSLLEIGTGRGYQTAVLAQLARHVWSIDIVEEFVEIAQSRMVVLDNENVTLRAGDGSRGWANAAPFDKIIVAAAADEPPDRLLEQLNPGGRLVIPLRRRGSSANHADCKGHRWLDGEAPSYPCEVLTFGISPSSARPERSKTAMASSLVPSYNWCGANGNWKRRRRPDGRRSYASPENAAGARHTECNWHGDHRIGVLYTRSALVVERRARPTCCRISRPARRTDCTDRGWNCRDARISHCTRRQRDGRGDVACRADQWARLS